MVHVQKVGEHIRRDDVSYFIVGVCVMRVGSRLIVNDPGARRLSGESDCASRTDLVPDSAVLPVWAPRAGRTTKPGHRRDLGLNGNALFKQPRWAQDHRGYIDGDTSEDRSTYAIVVIHNCKFVRDCLVRCLEISYRRHDVLSFESILEWKNAVEPRAQSPEALVFFSNTNGSSSIDPEILKVAAAAVPVIVMSDNESLEWVLSVIKSGVRGYIPTTLPLSVAVEAVRFILAGGTYVPVNSLHSDLSKQFTLPAGKNFTGRQTMVVQALCKGMANKQIAYQLGLSEHTVKVHLRHIMKRLNVRNRTELAMQAQGFLEEDGRWSPPTAPHGYFEAARLCEESTQRSNGVAKFTGQRAEIKAPPS